MHLLNGNTHERSRSSEGVRVLECGCACSDVSWLQMCDAHHAGFAELHKAAASAHRDSNSYKE